MYAPGRVVLVNLLIWLASPLPGAVYAFTLSSSAKVTTVSNFESQTLNYSNSNFSVNMRGLSLGFSYGSRKVRGVNLGGWLVLEVSPGTDLHLIRPRSFQSQPWISPSLFENTGDGRVVDEWTFNQYQSKSVAKMTLKRHWDTWITEKDFAEIAAAG